MRDYNVDLWCAEKHFLTAWEHLVETLEKLYRGEYEEQATREEAKLALTHLLNAEEHLMEVILKSGSGELKEKLRRMVDKTREARQALALNIYRGWSISNMEKIASWTWGAAGRLDEYGSRFEQEAECERCEEDLPSSNPGPALGGSPSEENKSSSYKYQVGESMTVKNIVGGQIVGELVDSFLGDKTVWGTTTVADLEKYLGLLAAADLVGDFAGFSVSDAIPGINMIPKDLRISLFGYWFAKKTIPWLKEKVGGVAAAPSPAPSGYEGYGEYGMQGVTGETYVPEEVKKREVELSVSA